MSIQREFPPRSEQLSHEDLLELYRTMVTIRIFEDQVQQCFLDGMVRGTTHLCQGQEAVSAGAMKALRPDDYVTCTYRGHGQCLARGMQVTEAMQEIFGRAGGVCKGKGGSMHLTDISRGLLGSFAIVGAGLPVAVGAGLSAQLRGEGQISATFFGDGSTNIGAFHESLNLAAVWSLPVIFVCENNLYGEYTPIRETTPVEDLASRAAGYDMPGSIVDGNDVLAVYDAMADAVERGRRGDGPTFVECKTYRQCGHSRTDPAKYRTREELDAWVARDPLPGFLKVLGDREILSPAASEELVREIEEQIQAAAHAAEQAPWPEESRMGEDVLV